MSSPSYQSASSAVLNRASVASSTPSSATFAISSSIAASTASASVVGLYSANTVNSVGPSYSQALVRPYSESTLRASSRPFTNPWYSREASPSASSAPSTAISAWSSLPRSGIFQAAAIAGTCASASADRKGTRQNSSH